MFYDAILCHINSVRPKFARTHKTLGVVDAGKVVGTETLLEEISGRRSLRGGSSNSAFSVEGGTLFATLRRQGTISTESNYR